MSRLRFAFWSALSALLIIGATAAVYRFGASVAADRPLSVPDDDHELAYFHTATNFATWERFVAGIRYAARLQPRLRVDDSDAFPGQTTAVPQVVITLDGSNRRLLVRWYKQSAQMNVSDWVRALAQRDRPPLAIVGGGSSDRALELARTLAQERVWNGKPPLLFITTATAGMLTVEGSEFKQEDLMRVYPGRSFRFCFTNQQMARAVIDFVWATPELAPRGSPTPSLGIVPAAAGSLWTALGFLAAQGDYPGEVFTLKWRDDPYSMDLADQFRDVLFLQGEEIDPAIDRPWAGQLSPRAVLDIGSSVGGFLRPNVAESTAINLLSHGAPFIPPIPRRPMQRSLLILPTVPPPGRRVLAGLTGASPGLGQQLVAVSGDGISFNHVYRDGQLIWNMRLVPVPLVFFAHQDPVAWDNEHDDTIPPPRLLPPNGTDDVRHFAEVTRIIAEAVYDLKPNHGGSDEMLADADELANRLLTREPAYFDGEGNRLGGRGEYVIYLRPRHNGLGPPATLEVWTKPDPAGWRRVRPPIDIKDR